MLWASKDFLFFSSMLSNVEKREMDLPVMRTSKVLELPLQRRQGWLEGACCCCMFAELGRVFLAAFLVFPKGIGHLPSQQPPAFWERSL